MNQTMTAIESRETRADQLLQQARDSGNATAAEYAMMAHRVLWNARMFHAKHGNGTRLVTRALTDFMATAQHYLWAAEDVLGTMPPIDPHDAPACHYGGETIDCTPERYA